MSVRQQLNTFYAFLVPDWLPDEERVKLDAILNDTLLSSEEREAKEREEKAKQNVEALKALRGAFSLPS